MNPMILTRLCWVVYSPNSSPLPRTHAKVCFELERTTADTYILSKPSSSLILYYLQRPCVFKIPHLPLFHPKHMCLKYSKYGLAVLEWSINAQIWSLSRLTIHPRSGLPAHGFRGYALARFLFFLAYSRLTRAVFPILTQHNPLSQYSQRISKFESEIRYFLSLP